MAGGRDTDCLWGVELLARDPNNDEKKLVATALTGFGSNFFRDSVLEVYIQFITVAWIVTAKTGLE